MSFDFGKNLRDLRVAKGLTQEQAAELLNVSKQSVSRWENNTTYPDITFLPSLASFYGVTVDSLLGADFAFRFSTLEGYRTQHREAHHLGDTVAALELSQALYAQLPNEAEVMSDLMIDAYLMSFGQEGEKRRHYLELSTSVAERFLKMTDDLEEQCRCIRYISLCHKALGQPEQAQRWMMKLPSVWSGIELTALEVLEGETRLDHIRSSLCDLADILKTLIFVYAKEGTLPREERVRVLEKLPCLLEIFFEKGDYGLFTVTLSRAYAELAVLSKDLPEKCREYTQKAFEYADAFDNLTPGVHSSLLFRGMTYSPKDFSKNYSKTQHEMVVARLSDEADETEE